MDYYSQEIEQQQKAISEEYNKLVEANNAKIESIKNTADTNLETLKSRYDKEIEALSARYEKGEITEEAYTSLKQARDEAYATSKTNIETNLEKTLADIQTRQEDAEKKAYEEKNRLGREAFEANKKVQIANIAVNTASAIIKAFAELGWIAGGIASVALGTTAGVQIATINKQQYTPVALAKGGITQGATQVLIGEDGKEAVLPLEKNTEWIDLLANKLNAVMQRDTSTTTMTSYGARNISNNYTQIINAPKTPSRRELYRDGKNLLALKGAF